MEKKKQSAASGVTNVLTNKLHGSLSAKYRLVSKADRLKEGPELYDALQEFVASEELPLYNKDTVYVSYLFMHLYLLLNFCCFRITILRWNQR